jgi:S-adenosylmethionine hydrolase
VIIKQTSVSYAGGEKGELLAIVGSSGFLEISLNKGSALEFFGGKLPAVKILKG